MDLSAGARVDRYLLEQRLGSGGQAEVWRAHEPELPERRWALKLVQIASVTPSKLERLRREARALSRLSHPSLVGYFGLFEDPERSLLGIVMEHVEGRSLERLIGDRRFDERKRTLVLDHVANALAHVHGQSVVHRDVKLENVLVTEAFFSKPEDPKTVKLIDFGIAVEAANPQPLTRAGHVMGTAPHLAPEQLEPAYWNGATHAQTAACDVFAFGILAWRLLANDRAAHPTGVRGTDLDEFAIAYRRSEHDRWPPSSANPRWDVFFRRALALRPSDRLADGSALAAQLTALPTLDDAAAPTGKRVITVPGEPPLLAAGELAPTQSERSPRRRTPLIAFALLFVMGAAVGIAAFAGYLLLQTDDEGVPPLPAPSSIQPASVR